MPEHITALDVDHTTLHHEGVTDVLLEFSERVAVPRRHAEQVLAAQAVSFSCHAFLEALDRPKAMPDLEATLAAHFANCYYDDVVPFLRWAAEHSRLVLVTRGDPHLQHLKITPIRDLVDDVLVTETVGEKGTVLRDRYGDYQQLVFVDDRQDELDAAERVLDSDTRRLHLFQIIRPDTTHPTPGKHPIIATLNDIRSVLYGGV
jgi:FMN phosphatase YigB (HAD superfamily)